MNSHSFISGICRAAAIAVSAWAISEHAAALGLDRVQVEIAADAVPRESTLRLYNDSDRTAHYAAYMNEWSVSPQGEDELSPTTELRVRPPVLRLLPGQSGEFSFRFNGAADLATERSYRVRIQEVAGLPRNQQTMARASLAGQSLEVNTELSIPIYVLPLSAPPAFSGATAFYGQSDGQWWLHVRNAGVQRFMLQALEIDGKREESGVYVLAGTEVKLPLNAGATQTAPNSVELLLLRGDQTRRLAAQAQ